MTSKLKTIKTNLKAIIVLLDRIDAILIKINKKL